MFTTFAKQVNHRLNQLAKGELFVTVDGDTLWDTYLDEVIVRCDSRLYNVKF